MCRHSDLLMVLHTVPAQALQQCPGKKQGSSEVGAWSPPDQHNRSIIWPMHCLN